MFHSGPRVSNASIRGLGQGNRVQETQTHRGDGDRDRAVSRPTEARNSKVQGLLLPSSAQPEPMYWAQAS